MNNRNGYDQWAESYDDIINKTRDLEGLALIEILSHIPFSMVLEIGCGTGKNTEWISEHARQIIAVDFSIEMVNKAKKKVKKDNIDFRHADITVVWEFENSVFDLVTASLVLEHIQDLDHIFDQAGKVLRTGGYFYIGELHPFKQYEGSKARFEKAGETFILDCYTHHISDYFLGASINDFDCILIKESFDEDRQGVPRVLSLLFRKK